MPNGEVKKFLNSMFSSLRESLQNAGYRVSLNKNNNRYFRYFTVTKGKLTSIYRIHRVTKKGELVLMDMSNNRMVLSANGTDLAKKIRLQMALNRQRKFLYSRYGTVYGKKGLFAKISWLNKFFNRATGTFSNTATNNEKYRENAKFRKMKNAEQFESFNKVGKTQPVKKSKALEETDFNKKKEVKSLLANDRVLYGTKMDIKEKVQKDLQQHKIKQQNLMENLNKEKEEILTQKNINDQDIKKIYDINKKIQQSRDTNIKILNKDITVDVAEKLGYLLPGCNIKYESSFAVGTAGQRMCNFNITFGGITRRCAIVEGKHYLTKQPLYSVSTEIRGGPCVGGALTVNSLDELAKKIAEGMLKDIEVATFANCQLLNDRRKYDLREAQNRIQQISDRRFDVDNRASRILMKDLHNDRNINI